MALTWDEVEFEFWVGQRRDGGVKAWQWRGMMGSINSNTTRNLIL